ncbi:MAG: carbamoyl-phosphate synthase small subunit [Glaciecola sp.]|jgi:carbamoyl-phosphate synthase small subunit
MNMHERPAALLVLEDGTSYRGRSFGALGTSFGEAVFNTAMTGYQEVLTDPSYRRQVVVMTAVQIGNYGINEVDVESDRVQVAGFVVREAARRTSNWRATGDLDTHLAQQDVVAIEGVDTRALTRRLRDVGAMRCGVSTEILDPQVLLSMVLEQPSMEGSDLAREVTISEPKVIAAVGEQRFRVVALDFGMKANIGRMLAQHGCEVHVLPASATAQQVLALSPDGVFLSNGPGDPAAVTYAVSTVRELLGKVPMFGICLGSQLLALALGAGTFKLRYGHHGMNLPVLRREDGTVEITSQNHGFAVDPASFGEDLGEMTWQSAQHGRVRVTHVNMNDDTVAGIACLDLPAFGVQYHPEAAPGPHDSAYLFDRFTELMVTAPASA